MSDEETLWIKEATERCERLEKDFHLVTMRTALKDLHVADDARAAIRQDLPKALAQINYLQDLLARTLEK